MQRRLLPGSLMQHDPGAKVLLRVSDPPRLRKTGVLLIEREKSTDRFLFPPCAPEGPPFHRELDVRNGPGYGLHVGVHHVVSLATALNIRSVGDDLRIELFYALLDDASHGAVSTALTRGITSSAISRMERRARLASAQSWPV